jgi:hypothetical protein
VVRAVGRALVMVDRAGVPPGRGRAADEPCLDVLGHERHVDVAEVDRQAPGRDHLAGFVDQLGVIDASVVARVVGVDPAGVVGGHDAAACGQRTRVVDRRAQPHPVPDVSVRPEVLVQCREHVAVLAARRGDITEVGADDALVAAAHRVARWIPVDRGHDDRPGRRRPHHGAAVPEQRRSAVGGVTGVMGKACSVDGYRTHDAAETTMSSLRDAGLGRLRRTVYRRVRQSARRRDHGGEQTHCQHGQGHAQTPVSRVLSSSPPP